MNACSVFVCIRKCEHVSFLLKNSNLCLDGVLHQGTFLHRLDEIFCVSDHSPLLVIAILFHHPCIDPDVAQVNAKMLVVELQKVKWSCARSSDHRINSLDHILWNVN